MTKRELDAAWEKVCEPFDKAAFAVSCKRMGERLRQCVEARNKELLETVLRDMHHDSP